MADFKRAFASAMRHEGGYANHPDDRGRETYKGISRRFWPKWSGWKHVDRAKEEIGYEPKYGTKEYREWVKLLDKVLGFDPELQALVVSFYHQNFWLPVYERIKPDIITDWLFDKHINTGSKYRVARWIQQALGTVKVDGIIGWVTARAINDYPGGPAELLEKAREHARAYYRGIVERRPSQAKFLNGWLARV